ncbi:hypothetical protein BASA81_007437 [Batrachochytrium salamandrivorans]|nr:hypothetical protein BASA81_007437 [Batrachochytrium salamandrivorans]
MLQVCKLTERDETCNEFQECIRRRIAGELPKVFTPNMQNNPQELIPSLRFHLEHDWDCVEELGSLGVFRSLKQHALQGNEQALECMCDLQAANTLHHPSKLFDESSRHSPLRINIINEFLLLRYLQPRHEFAPNRPNFEVGFTLWGASLVFCRFVLERPEVFSEKSVLELGSGMGLGGLAVAKFAHPQRVVLSDFHPDVVSNCAFNAKLNGLVVQSIALDWETIGEGGDEEKFDVVIGTDVICQAKDCESVCDVLHVKLSQPNGQAVFVLGGAESRYGRFPNRAANSEPSQP